MDKYIIGIDSGSTYCKAVLFSEGNLIDKTIVKSGWQPEKIAMNVTDYLIDNNNINKSTCKIITTGYGRESITFAHKTLTEITAHSLGGFYLEPEISGIIDIGGQDSKVIKTKNGKVMNFHMNDKCAAGTGRFLDMACNTLDIPIDELDIFLNTKDFVHINSMCTVFAESEIIGLMSASTPRELVINGVLRSIAIRIQGVLSKLQLQKNDILLMTGGLSRSKKIVEIISEVTGFEVITNEKSPFAGAIGAAVSGIGE